MAQVSSIVRAAFQRVKKIVGTLPATFCALGVLLAHMMVSARVATFTGMGVDAFIQLLILFGFGYVCIVAWCLAAVLRMVAKHEMPRWAVVDKALALCISSSPGAVWIALVYAMVTL